MFVNEEWRPALGYRGEYEVSSLGRVRSLSRLNRRGRRMYGRILSPRLKRHGRLSVVLCGKEIYVHRLVLLAFVGPPPDGTEACHADGDPRNNAASNLRWDTHVSNMADRDKHGRTMRGDAHCFAQLTTEEVLFLRNRRRQTGETFASLARLADKPEMMVWQAVTGGTWAHLPGACG